ncbi:MAG: hypothetical protein ACK559_03250, partial [bacterium]
VSGGAASEAVGPLLGRADRLRGAQVEHHAVRAGPAAGLAEREGAAEAVGRRPHELARVVRGDHAGVVGEAAGREGARDLGAEARGPARVVALELDDVRARRQRHREHPPVLEVERVVVGVVEQLDPVDGEAHAVVGAEAEQ